MIYTYRGEILPGMGGLHAVGLAYEVALPWLSVGGRVSYGQGRAENLFLSSITHEVGLSAEARRALDLGPVTVAAGLAVGAAFLGERFTTLGRAPPRDALALQFGGLLELTVGLPLGLSVRGIAELRGYVLPGPGEGGDALTLASTYALGGGLGVSF